MQTTEPNISLELLLQLFLLFEGIAIWKAPKWLSDANYVKDLDTAKKRAYQVLGGDNLSPKEQKEQEKFLKKLDWIKKYNFIAGKWSKSLFLSSTIMSLGLIIFALCKPITGVYNSNWECVCWSVLVFCALKGGFLLFALWKNHKFGKKYVDVSSPQAADFSKNQFRASDSPQSTPTNNANILYEVIDEQ